MFLCFELSRSICLSCGPGIRYRYGAFFLWWIVIFWQKTDRIFSVLGIFCCTCYSQVPCSRQPGGYREGNGFLSPCFWVESRVAASDWILSLLHCLVQASVVSVDSLVWHSCAVGVRPAGWQAERRLGVLSWWRLTGQWYSGTLEGSFDHLGLVRASVFAVGPQTLSLSQPCSPQLWAGRRHWSSLLQKGKNKIPGNFGIFGKVVINILRFLCESLQPWSFLSAYISRVSAVSWWTLLGVKLLFFLRILTLNKPLSRWFSTSGPRIPKFKQWTCIRFRAVSKTLHLRSDIHSLFCLSRLVISLPNRFP